MCAVLTGQRFRPRSSWVPVHLQVLLSLPVFIRWVRAWLTPDVVKTRLQLQRKAAGAPQYRGIAQTLVEIVRNEGYVCVCLFLMQPRPLVPRDCSALAA